MLVSDGRVESLLLTPAPDPHHEEDDAEKEDGEVGGENWQNITGPNLCNADSDHLSFLTVLHC